MSLEQKIELLTAAVVELTRVMQTQTVLVELKPNELQIAQSRQQEVAEAIALQQVVASEHAGKEDPNAEAKPSTTTDTSPPSSNESRTVTYDDVKNITIAVSKIDKAKAVAGLARFGVTTAKALNENQWLDYVVYMEKVQKGELDPEASHE